MVHCLLVPHIQRSRALSSIIPSRCSLWNKAVPIRNRDDPGRSSDVLRDGVWVGAGERKGWQGIRSVDPDRRDDHDCRVSNASLESRTRLMESRMLGISYWLYDMITWNHVMNRTITQHSHPVTHLAKPSPRSSHSCCTCSC